jgi:hypothetical protein
LPERLSLPDRLSEKLRLSADIFRFLLKEEIKQAGVASHTIALEMSAINY